MTALEQAIRDAVEKGDYEALKECLCCGKIEKFCRCGYESTLLDPAFWQALGKARGWVYADDDGTPLKKQPRPAYMFYWHHLIDHLASGKSIEDFFIGLE